MSEEATELRPEPAPRQISGSRRFFATRRGPGRFGAFLLKLPIHLYRYTVKPWTGWQCRHLPTCSEYALESIDKNGPWRGLWLTVSRLSRCQPWGSSGYDPVPDLTREHHPLRPWRYGRWSRHTSRM